MNIILNRLIILSLLGLGFSNFIFSQDSSCTELRFKLNKVNPTVSIKKETLVKAVTLSDINSNFETTWIKKYISVEIQTSQNGTTQKSISKNDSLNQEQKDLLNIADLGKNITVKVQYLPNNTLSQNDIKEISFSFKVVPEKDAQYLGGLQELEQYLKDEVIDKISESFQRSNVSFIKFTVDEEGKVVNAHVFHAANQSDGDDKIEKLVLQTISKMPNWKPSEYSNGLKVKQDFVLIVGNMESCLINFLGNIVVVI